MGHTYKYPRPAFTVDCVLFAVIDRKLKVLVIRRGEDPYKGCLALPGGFVQEGESAEQAVRREVLEETGFKIKGGIASCGVWSDPCRDPRGWVVSAAFWALVAPEKVQGGSDAALAKWVDYAEDRVMAFDHVDILEEAMRMLQQRIRREPIGFDLLPDTFTLTQLQEVYEAVFFKEVDKRNFRRKVLKLAILRKEKPLGMRRGRPAVAYSFHHEKYMRRVEKGIGFEI